MKTRLSTMAVAVLSASLFTACGGGSGSSDFPVTIPPPRVTVTAPATATVDVGFTVAWDSSGATSCNAGALSSATDAKKSVTTTETTIGTKIYSVTCTGDGGSTTNKATVIVSAAPTAEGAWVGTTGDNRAITGIVLAPDATSGANAYWLAYTEVGNTVPAGFVAGIGTSTATNISSSDLREFNFAAGRVNAAGNLNAPFVKKATLGPGSFTDIDSATNPVFPIGYTVTSTAQSPSNYNNVVNFPVASTLAGTASLAGNGVLTMSVSGRLSFDVSPITLVPGDAGAADPLAQSFQLKTTTNGTGTYHLIETATVTNPDDSYFQTTQCNAADTSNIFALCGKTPFSFPASTKTKLFSGDTANHIADDPTFYSSQSFSWSGGTIKVRENIDGTMGLDYVINYILAPVPTSSSTITTFSLAYSASYETAPSLAAVAGSYTTGVTGIDATMQTTASLTIAAGSISGTESVSHCNYSGTIAPHTTGNVYDVTALTFTSSGGTCVYASSGAFTGVATLDSAIGKTLTLTALDATRSKGFMVVANKP